VLKGQAVIGLYFSADWCPPCQAFSPLLRHLHSSKRAHCDSNKKNIPPFEVVLVSRCKDARATEHYFSAMPWTAMTHDEASGKTGLDLLHKFGITTIPALVLLDGEGAVVCRNAQEKLQEDPAGLHFPWQYPPAVPRIKQVGFNLVDTSRPDVARLSNPLRRPPGRPLQLTTVRPSCIRDPQNKKEAAIAHGDRGPSIHCQGTGALLAKNTRKTRQEESAATQQVVNRQPQQGVTPQPAPTTPRPASTLPKQKTKVPANRPWPRPPPKPNVFGQSSPNMSVKAGAASTPTAASSNDLQSVLCPIVGTELEYQKVGAWDRGGLRP
jgi:thiol-disulfide isomerase/thioredoxin